MRIDEVGGLRIATFGAGPRTIIAAHGITASLMAWAAVGRRLPDGWSLVAVDLRGRGHSAALPGPYGLPRHAEDVLRVADHVGASPDAVLTGHSMGAYVAALAGARREFARVVLVDGGIPLPAIPEGTDPDAALEAVLGPALARLRRTFPSAEAYVDFFKAHPAFAGRWNADVEAYVRYDLTGPEGALRSRAVGEAVLADGRWLHLEQEALAAALKAITAPLLLLRAPRGLLDQPTGMLPDELVRPWADRLPGLRDEVVPDCNHYTILFDERCVATVVDRLTAPL
ncbi:alpha/beta fold hydrolase [Nonomuraea gerenzanensis]|uniref:Hydrolase, alpha/beta fold family n=1 Tax=Nonomuraea gerenzanensis TaxID=93944 RepID=A0A1M4E6B9_9ACTN|nr:alpha/beta hydrolase [Nonomuraea gerenzanensis]UBU16564.1 alpha/beta hydrolase [Nonomuraea gerenzanensis]SBO94391.1 Hydrolase, alpha/beta fold family [Nonomuraea gerenzanensis]